MDVLGSLSFLSTPDVNGVLVLTSSTGTTGISGTANQISVSGSLPTFTVGLASDPIVPGTGSLTMPIGTTAQRPASPAAGMTRFNSSLNVLEYYSGTAWIAGGRLVQMVTGSITSLSSNVQIPFDNTTPTSAEGVQLWSQAFTPVLDNSTIIITTTGFFSVNSANNVWTSGAVFNGTTCIFAQGLGYTTDLTEGGSFTVVATDPSVSTATRTYSFRAGPNSAVTVFYMQGSGGQGFGSATNSGRYIIQEYAP